MEKKLFFEKQFLDENGREFRLAYWLITRSAKRERTYGVAVEKLVRRESANMMRSVGFRRNVKTWRSFCGGFARGLPFRQSWRRCAMILFLHRSVRSRGIGWRYRNAARESLWKPCGCR